MNDGVNKLMKKQDSLLNDKDQKVQTFKFQGLKSTFQNADSYI